MADEADAGKEYPEFPGEKLSKRCGPGLPPRSAAS
jgi:hypothetical protein